MPTVQRICLVTELIPPDKLAHWIAAHGQMFGYFPTHNVEIPTLMRDIAEVLRWNERMFDRMSERDRDVVLGQLAAMKVIGFDYKAWKLTWYLKWQDASEEMREWIGNTQEDPEEGFTQATLLDRYDQLWNLDIGMSGDQIMASIRAKVDKARTEPVQLDDDYWLFGDYIHKVESDAKEAMYSAEERELLVRDAFDAERRKFERLRTRFAGSTGITRPRIPESVRVEV